VAAQNDAAARKAMAELVDLAFFDTTNAPKWPSNTSGTGRKRQSAPKKSVSGKRRAAKR
jgi:hypothetical protein